MIGEKMEAALNRQINAELYSEYLYLAMAAYFESKNFGGFAHWMRVQAQEEHTHAMKFFQHVVDRGGRVKLAGIDEPKFEWKGPADAFDEAYNHEVHVTSLINGLVELAQTQKDTAAFSMLQWFVDEQVEEESTADGIRQKLKDMKEGSPGLLIMDQALSHRKAD